MPDARLMHVSYDGSDREVFSQSAAHLRAIKGQNANHDGLQEKRAHSGMRGNRDGWGWLGMVGCLSVHFVCVLQRHAETF